jgi:hypothetical protein
VSDGYALKTSPAFGVTPGNIQHIRFDFTFNGFQPGHLIVTRPGRFPFNPRLM